MDKYLQSHDWDRAFTLNCQLHHLRSLAHRAIMKYFMAEGEGERELSNGWASERGERGNRTQSCNLVQ